MCAANIWHHVYILFSIMPLNCYHWRDSELSPWTEPGVRSGCYLEVLMEMAWHSPKMKHLVWCLKTDSFLLCSIILWTASSAGPGSVRVGFEHRAVTFNVTMWLTWNSLLCGSSMGEWIYLKGLNVGCALRCCCGVGFKLSRDTLSSQCCEWMAKR